MLLPGYIGHSGCNYRTLYDRDSGFNNYYIGHSGCNYRTTYGCRCTKDVYTAFNYRVMLGYILIYGVYILWVGYVGCIRWLQLHKTMVVSAVLYAAAIGTVQIGGRSLKLN